MCVTIDVLHAEKPDGGIGRAVLSRLRNMLVSGRQMDAMCTANSRSFKCFCTSSLY
jgi:hypothetical protein